MADDAGALLVRSGLVSSNALDDARARIASVGGTLGEQLVASGVITDDELTDFYRSRLLVPQVDPNLLARLPPSVVGTIPGDMAIELRSIPVSLDRDHNLTIAMSDPSDRHAVDEIAFFTGAYVLRAVATQMQIAWCLAHYYGHVTSLGQRLLQASQAEAIASVIAAAPDRVPRTKGVTGKVHAARHRAVAPITGPVDVLRPGGDDVDRVRLAASSAPIGTRDGASAHLAPGLASAVGPRPSSVGTPRTTPAVVASMAPGTPRSTPASTPPAALAGAPAKPPAETANGADATPSDGAPDRPRARSISGEIRVPVRRAESIRPPMPSPDDDDDLDGEADAGGAADDEPLIVIELDAPDDDTGPRLVLPPRRRVVQSDPPELYARAGEVDLKVGDDRSIDADEPRIVVDEDALSPPTARIATRPAARGDTAPPGAAVDAMDDADTGALIHARAMDRESQPILLDRPRELDDDRGRETEVVVLDARKPRPPRHTRIGIAPAPAVARPHRDTDGFAPTLAGPGSLDRTADNDPTTIDLRAAPPRGDESSDRLAAPPAPARDDDTNPHVVAPPPAPAPVRTSSIRPAVVVDEADEEDDDDEPPGPRTSVMTAPELDAAIPQRTAEVVPGHLARRRIDHDPVDDGWGPPGTTIPPPLLGAIPGGDDDDEAAHAIPMPSVDSSPLIVGPPALPSTGDSGGRALVRALEDATARAIDVIRRLERTQSRDEVVDVMVGHLAETHHRAGFFVTRRGRSGGGTAELGLFAITPRPAALPSAVLRLDRPSTLQDIVGTRLPYRGPMHDDASRAFLIAVLGACPPEILLVPVTVRERVVGVMFGEHRQRHTFDDQLALAARAAGMALERILKAKRG